MSDYSEHGQAIRATVAIAWADIRPPAGQELDFEQMANQVRYAWGALAPQIERGLRFLWSLVSPEEAQITLSDSAPPGVYTVLTGDPDGLWYDFRRCVAGSLVLMAALHTDPGFYNLLRARDAVVALLESLTDAPDPLEDAGEEAT